MPNSKKKVLIFGATGFLGVNFVRRILKKANVEITAIGSTDSLDVPNNLADVIDKITFIKGDIRDEKLLKKVVVGKDLIFNLAGQISHVKSIENPIYDAEVNSIGHLKLLMATLDRAPQAVVIYPSSISVIGETGGGIVDENIREKPLDIYSANKGVAEKYCRIFNKVHDLKTVVLRFGNLYGPYGKKDSALGFLNYFINLTADGENIKIFGEGSQTKNVMFIDDAVDISWQAAHEPKLFGETFFATHQDYHTIKKIAEAIVKEFGNSKIEYVSWPKIRKRIETKNVKFSSAKLHSLIDWQPKYSLAEGLKLTKERMGK